MESSIILSNGLRLVIPISSAILPASYMLTGFATIKQLGFTRTNGCIPYNMLYCISSSGNLSFSFCRQMHKILKGLASRNDDSM